MNTDQSKIRKIKDFIKKYFPFIPPIYRFIMHSIPDSWYLKGLYRIKMGKKLNLKNPKTFNEKLQWLKIHDRKPIYTTMVDKYEVKKYVARIIGEQYIIPTIGVWDSFDEIDFDSLPEKFVLKCTHDSGSVILCPDKSQFDVDAARKRLSLCLKNNYYWSGREWPYKNVKPRIIAEPYLVDESFTELKDYKIFNFDGEPKLIEVDWDRFVGHKRNLYSTDWDFINAQIQWPNDPNHVFDRPKALSEMLELAKKLSQGCPHVRSDFYCIDDKVLFGELTFYHECGISTFIPQEYENTLGDWIKLPSGGGIFRNSNFYIYIRFEKTESATATTRTSSLLSATPTSSNDDALVLSKQSSTSNPELLDFKLMCFNGKVRCSFVCTDRHSDSGLKVTFFDENWNKMPFSRHYPVSDKNIAMPSQYHRMVEIAEKFSADNPFIRVDFYEIQGQLYFGELTFYPGCGFEEFTPEEWDTTLGSWIKLPSRGGVVLLGDGYVLWLHKTSKSFYPDLRDYKFYCFGGIPTYCQVISDRRSNETIDFFDMNWEHQEFTGLTMPHKEFHNAPIPIPIPIGDMKKAATKLSEGIPFVRVDFYDIKGHMYFGEMTFYPNNGLGSFKPDKYNNIMGDLLVLP